MDQRPHIRPQPPCLSSSSAASSPGSVPQPVTSELTPFLEVFIKVLHAAHYTVLTKSSTASLSSLSPSQLNTPFLKLFLPAVDTDPQSSTPFRSGFLTQFSASQLMKGHHTTFSLKSFLLSLKPLTESLTSSPTFQFPHMSSQCS